MAKNRDSSGNPLKDDGQTKATTRGHADQDPPMKPRTPVSKTQSGQGGSAKGGKKHADTSHPSQHGGVKPPMDEQATKRALSTKPGQIGGEQE